MSWWWTFKTNITMVTKAPKGLGDNGANVAELYIKSTECKCVFALVILYYSVCF